jgi:hypothetical protein
VRLWRQQPTLTCGWPLFSVPPVVASGIRAAGGLLLYLVLRCVSGLLICGVGWIRLRARRKPGSLPSSDRLFVEFVAVLVTAFTGHPGGVLSGVNASGWIVFFEARICRGTLLELYVGAE